MKNEKKPSFSEKIKDLNLDDLRSYERTGLITNRVINIVGILIILSAIIFPFIPVVIAVVFTIYFLAHMSVGVDMYLEEIRTHIDKFRKTR